MRSAGGFFITAFTCARSSLAAMPGDPFRRSSGRSWRPSRPRRSTKHRKRRPPTDDPRRRRRGVAAMCIWGLYPGVAATYRRTIDPGVAVTGSRRRSAGARRRRRARPGGTRRRPPRVRRRPRSASCLRRSRPSASGATPRSARSATGSRWSSRAPPARAGGCPTRRRRAPATRASSSLGPARGPFLLVVAALAFVFLKRVATFERIRISARPPRDGARGPVAGRRARDRLLAAHEHARRHLFEFLEKVLHGPAARRRRAEVQDVQQKGLEVHLGLLGRARPGKLGSRESRCTRCAVGAAQGSVGGLPLRSWF